MSDWKSPAVIAAEYFALIKVCHVMAGILIWELVVYIGFEYSFLTGKRKFRSSFLECGMINSSWYIQLYLGLDGSLFSPLLLYSWDSTPQTRSTASWGCVVIFLSLDDFCLGPDWAAYQDTLSAAIWGLNKIAISITFIVWLVHAGFLIHSVVVLRAAWRGGVCTITNPSQTRNNIPVTLVTDLVLLVLMLTGLLRWENARQRGGVWWLLYTQGLAWMTTVVVAEALITVFILLNLNDAMNLMFQLPALLTLTICASRMYRGLADYFLHNEANVHISARLSRPIRFLAPRSGQSSVALGTSGLGKATHRCECESTNNEALGLKVMTTFELGGSFAMIKIYKHACRPDLVPVSI
ncbi:hypothetical protein EDB85DRAFT_2274910 [Lactarius pseudohatsudake]|nr:hypothetical protein EDB85DRAFT_2274910 [Lactarius pseudohatsudake]